MRSTVGDEHVAKYGGRLKGGTSEEIDRQYNHFVIRYTTFAEGLQDGMKLTIFYFLKDRFLLEPAAVALCFGIMMFPWFLKPVYAYVSDFFPINGEKRRPYIIGASLANVVCYLGVGLSATATQAVFSLTLCVACRAFVSAVVQGFLVEETRAGNTDTSDFVSEYFWLRGLGSLCTAYFSGTLLSAISSTHLLQSLAVLPLTAACLGVFIDERNDLELEQSHCDNLTIVKDLVQSPSFFGPMLFLLAFSSGPDYDDALNYYFVNKLHFTPDFMSLLQLIHAVARLVGIGVYRYFCVNAAPKDVFLKTTLISIPFYLMPALITTGFYHMVPGLSPKVLALGGELLRESVLYIQMIPALVMVAKVAPKDMSATAFSTITAMGNMGRGLQRISSAVLLTALGVSATNFSNLTPLIVVCGLGMAAPLSILPLVPDDEKDATDAGGILLEGRLAGTPNTSSWPPPAG